MRSIWLICCRDMEAISICSHCLLYKALFVPQNIMGLSSSYAPGSSSSRSLSMSMQFRPAVTVPAVPVQQSQPYNPMASQHFQHVGHANIGLPSCGQQLQYSQQVQQPPASHGLGGPGCSHHRQYRSQKFRQAGQVYLYHQFGGSSGGQLQRNADAPTQYRPTSQTNVTSFSVGEQPRLPTGCQSITSVVPVQPIEEAMIGEKRQP